MEPTLFDNLKIIFIRYRFDFLKAFLMLTFSNILLISNPLMFRKGLAVVLSSSNVYTAIIPWVLLLIIITLISVYFKYWMRVKFIAISREIEVEVREKLFSRIENQSKAFFDNHGIGELLSRLTNDISAYRDLLGPGIMYPLFALTLILPGIAAIFYISPYLAIISFTPIIIIPIINNLLRKKIYQLSKQVQFALGRLSNITQEYFSGIKIIKGYRVEIPTLKFFSKVCKTFSLESFWLSSFQGMIFPLLTMVTKLTTLLFVLIAGYIILKGSKTLSLEDFLSFMWIQTYIFVPVLMLGWILPIYERGKAAYRRLVEIYEEPIQVQDNPHSQLEINEKMDLEFRDLSFTYSSDLQPVLKNLNMKILGGSFVGITGPVGAGKTTLLDIIKREYEIPFGMFYIGEHEIHEYSLDTIRKSIVTVEQGSFLFSRTVAENVRFGRKEASQEEIERVSQYADLHEAIMEFPDRYDTIVGERGATLSGGQRQRLAMARAFLVNRSILLLDDIFSAVDTSTEKHIFKAIKKHFTNKTVLLVTHRISILEKLDRVIYLMNGEIVEDDSPQNLKKLKGHYAALAELQKIQEKSL